MYRYRGVWAAANSQYLGAQDAKAMSRAALRVREVVPEKVPRLESLGGRRIGIRGWRGSTPVHRRVSKEGVGRVAWGCSVVAYGIDRSQGNH